MTLIEMLGVLAILAILASLMLPALIKQTDKVVADQESASMQSFGSALQRSILRNRRIPGPAGLDWATNIAVELGLDLGTVTTNVRRQPRVFLVDTNGFGPLTLPYVQNNAGTLRPPNPRFMLVSSLGRELPTAVVTGRPATSDFNNLWNSAPGTVPTTGAWAGWNGNPNDITVQRVSLSPLFVNLWLSTYYSSWDCAYAIDAGSPSPPITSWVNSYFLQDSMLTLWFTNAQTRVGTLDSQQILLRDGSFVFYGNEWRRSLGTNVLVAGPGGGPGSGGTNLLGGYNFASLINGFLAANPTYLTRNQQTNVVQGLIDYMTAYNDWASSGFNATNGLYNLTVQRQSVVQNNVDTLMGAIRLRFPSP